MKWNIQKNDDNVVIVQMNSNPVNKQNPDFFRDLQEAFDFLDKEHPQLPIVLTGNDKLFSAGIDFDYSFELFSRQNHEEIREWFKQFSGAILRVFESDRLVVAAINGHCFAGGLILALCCDFRIGALGNSKYSLNEVPIGIPMPGTYTEIIRYRIGNKNASDTILSGAVYNGEQAKEIGFIHDLVSQERLIEQALMQARCIPKAAWPAYVQSKKILRSPILNRIKDVCLPIDLTETVDIISCDASIVAQKAAYGKLKDKN